MELKEYIKIFRKNINWLISSVILVLFMGLSIQIFLSGKYKVVLDLNITRTGYQENTNEYRYDEFYRLQADEKFADTVVQWIKSERLKEDIFNDSGKLDFEKMKAERLSSQMIRLSFVVKDRDSAKKVSIAVGNVLNEKTRELNLEQKNPNWFKILVSEPILNDYRIPLGELFFILLIGGIFVGFWVVLIKHYWE